MRRLIIEMGMGVDLRGGDLTKAAERGIRSCLGHVALPVLEQIDGAEIRVTIGVADPSGVDADRLRALFPLGDVSITVRQGGLVSADHVIAAVAIEVFVPEQSGWQLTTGPSVDRSQQLG